ncbi:MAG: UDP-glucose/GDP-mannose dehydrogenase family protein [Patescibacteria group bacterium]|jgi:UDPglucose 6-dehydrogenase
MKVTVVGAGWVGIISAATLAHFGHEVVLTDNREERIIALARGDLPFFEPGLDELFQAGIASGKVRVVKAEPGTMADADIVLCSVGTPPLPNGAADLSAVFEVARDFGRGIERSSVFVVRSTVPPGTGKFCQEMISEELRVRGSSVAFCIGSNPEFLAEGTAIRDSLEPERIIIGSESEGGESALKELYAPLLANGVPLLSTNIPTSELTKYAANAFLATKVSFINEIANYAELVGASAQDIAKGMGLDSRIGPKFLRPGIGYGGSCLPKDVRALVAAGKEAGYRFQIIPEVDRVNVGQRVRMYEAFAGALGSVRGKRIVLWGVSYKPGTDDTRESPALYFIDRLLREGATVVTCDPKVGFKIRVQFPQVEVAVDAESSLKGADALALLTEWPEFLSYTLSELRTRVREGIVLDARGVLQKR